MARRPAGIASAQHPALSAALRECRRAFWSVAVFSGVVNLLMLAGPLYMLQVYDRVLASQSVPTLIALTILLVGAYGLQAIMDLIRTRVVVRAASLLDRHLGTVVHAAVIRLAAMTRGVDPGQPVRDLDQVRAFLTGQGPLAIVDLPWMPVFLFICFLIHPMLGGLALLGAVVLVSTTLLTERASRGPARETARETGARSNMVEASKRNSESIVAMGLGDVLGRRWARLNETYLAASERSSDVVSSYGSVSKVLRMLLQSGMLGLGAYLVIKQEVSPGAMIASSIMMGRALAPIETAIANWRGFVAARDSIRRLSETLNRIGVAPDRTELPKAQRSLEVENVAVAPPESQRIIIANINFRAVAGEVVGIIGPSGSGKTTLVRALVGVWRPARGSIRLDGAALDQWSPDVLGPNVGYVAQAIDLFDGTVSENIARMSLTPDSDQVVRAANAAGAHDMVLHLPDGYDTRIGDSGGILSGGQRQRIALARALYSDPFLLVLDEPNANLDNDGELALFQSIREAKARGAIVLMIAHRMQALSVCDKLLVLRDGVQRAFGPRDEVLRQLQAQAQSQPQPQAPAPPPPPPTPATMSGSLKIVGGEAGGGAA